MHPAIIKSFGGLSRAYYIRQFVFGLIFPAFMIFMSTQSTRPFTWDMALFMCVSSLLYPYSRFVYESIVEFILGQNTFYVNALLVLFVKLITMALCWSLAIFIAPFGLLFLYFYHSKHSAQADYEEN